MEFNPFENRLCRDVRNSLGHYFIKAIQTRDPRCFQLAVKAYPSTEMPPHINDYIHHRQDCLTKVFDQIPTDCTPGEELVLIAFALWNLDLFFEFHEWLEIQWTAARGNNKKALQALILSAVVYEQLAYGRTMPAKKLAAKTVLLFEQYRRFIPKGFDTDLMIRKLTRLDPVPPRFRLPRQGTIFTA